MNRTLRSLAFELHSGRVTSRGLVTECLERIRSPGEGTHTFLKVHAEQALAAADFYDQSRRRGLAPGSCAGIPVSVKDLFDLAGDVTTAGSRVLQSQPPRTTDAPAIARLKAAGFIVIGRTNMTEFAFSGLGVNPHYGTPLNPWDRATGRIPGGSSSGAAVSVSDGMAFAAAGTDTGGSCRIPAAMCGVVGFKPTASRIPREGAYPLSTTLDSIGPLANSVECCAILDSAFAGQFAGPENSTLLQIPVGELRLGVLSSYVTDGTVPEVADAYQRFLARLAQQGARLVDINLRELEALPEINRNGGLPAAEAFSFHRQMLTARGSEYDPRVASRILRGATQDAAEYIHVQQRRTLFIEQVSRQIERFDAVIMPTIPVLAPKLSEVAVDEDYVRLNGLVLRNPSLVNFLDGCAISIPIHEPGNAPVGLTLFGLRNTDRHLLAVAAAVEKCGGSA